MPNLTEERNLVRRLSSVAPVPDHYLVVFKRTGDGKKLRACLQPGEPFKKPLLESPDSFVAFAVPGDRNLRHRFQRTFKSHDLVHSFILKFTLDYRISNAATLVEKVEYDPLRSLEDEIEDLLSQRNKSLDWASIEHEQVDLEEVLFHAHAGRRDEGDSALDKLGRFAGAIGIEVKRVVVTRDLPEEEISARKHRVEATRQQEIMVIDGETHTLAQGLDHDSRDRENAFNRRTKFADEVADGLGHVVGTVTSQARTVEDAIRIGQKLTQLTIPTGMTSTPALPSSATPGALPEARATSPAMSLVSTIWTTLGAIECDSADYRRLLSACLHLIAEACKAEEANHEVLALYTGALSALFEKLLAVLKPNQIKLLRELQDSEKLIRQLR